VGHPESEQQHFPRRRTLFDTRPAAAPAQARGCRRTGAWSLQSALRPARGAPTCPPAPPHCGPLPLRQPQHDHLQIVAQPPAEAQSGVTHAVGDLLGGAAAQLGDDLDQAGLA